jgi:hypothetical protein
LIAGALRTHCYEDEIKFHISMASQTAHGMLSMRTESSTPPVESHKYFNFFAKPPSPKTPSTSGFQDSQESSNTTTRPLRVDRYEELILSAVKAFEGIERS